MNAFTVDVESWAHASSEEFASLPESERRDGVMRGLEILLELLDRNHRKATFFVLGSVAEAVPDAVAAIRSGGHEIGSHGYSHRRVDEMAPEEFEEELVRTKDILEDQAGTKVKTFRAPKWSIYRARRWAFDVLARNGITHDSSLFPIPHVGKSTLPQKPYILRTAEGDITELPPLCSRKALPLGGTWGLRTLSYSAISRAVRRANADGIPAVFHIHPWEVDPWRPPLKQPFLTKLVLTVSFTDLPKRLDRLLREFEYTTLSETAKDVQTVYTPEELP